jgi:hypothetical protein
MKCVDCGREFPEIRETYGGEFSQRCARCHFRRHGMADTAAHFTRREIWRQFGEPLPDARGRGK